MKQVIDLYGRRFGKLTVIRLSDGYVSGKAKWLCQCDCGKTSAVFASNLTRLHTTSCGCHKQANYRTMNLKHGATAGAGGDKSRYPSSYKIWCHIRQRCYDPGCPAYKYYGGRGIVMCDSWQDYANFVADMGEPPRQRSLDRIDNDGPYSPENCRWATRTEQARNKRSAHLISFRGETRSLIEWAEHLGVSRNKLHNRIFRGWDIERAFTQPYRNSPSRGICISNE